MNDTPTEERIEEMLEVEHELAEQYEEHLSEEPDGPEDDRPADSQLNEYTGRIIDYKLKETNKKYLLFRILCHDGSTTTTPVDIPNDPTDETEELVRLCAYLGVSIDRIGDIQGKYVPMKPDSRDRYSDNMEIPPIQTRGNRLVYWCRRTARKYNAPWVVPSTQSAVGFLTTALALYCAYLFLQIPNHPTIFGGFLLVSGLVLAILSVILLLRPVYYGLEHVYDAVNALFRRFFPKP